MNKTATQPPITLELLTQTQETTNMHFLSMLESSYTPTIPTFTELLAEYKATIDKPAGVGLARSNELADPFAIYQSNLAQARPQPVRWLWQKRLPLAGITLIDGDRGCGKSLLALQIAACVSSGTPMPDGTPTLQGGVVIVTPHIDATTTQLQMLTALGANLSHVEILSYIQEPETSSHPSGYRPFSLPQDLPRLFQAVEHVNARLIIFDPFISLLSHDSRWTDQRLGHLLADLNQHLIQHHIACLITRNCHAKGGHARPSVLERSEHFATIATSRLLLAPDPMQPNNLLLAHALSRHTTLAPTLTLQIRPSPENTDLPHITILGTHSLQAKELINARPDTLHRQFLSQHLLQIIADARDPIPVANLYAHSPHSSAFQVQRSLNDLLHMGQIERPARGIYTLAQPARELNSSATTTSVSQSARELNSSAATTPIAQPMRELKSSAATTSIAQPAREPDSSTTTTSIAQPATELKSSAATTSVLQSARELNSSAATTPIAQPVTELNSSAATTPIAQPMRELDSSAATTSVSQSARELNSSTTTTLKPKAIKRPHKGSSRQRNTNKKQRKH